MKSFTLALPVLLLAGGALLIPRALHADQEPTAAELTAEQQMEMMMAVMTAGTPGPEHQELAKSVGEWDIATKYKMTPEADWSEATASSRISMALGGRYMVERFSGNFEGMPFEGILFLGYDNTRKEYVSIWMDSMSTRPSISTGTKDEHGTMTLSGLMIDPISPEGRATKYVSSPLPEGRMLMKMYDTIPPHGEVQVMEMVYTRKGGDQD
jgi:hypothetical protein